MNAPEMIVDMREDNPGAPTDTYKECMATIQTIVNEHTVEDNRRHGTAHFATFMSIRSVKMFM